MREQRLSYKHSPVFFNVLNLKAKLKVNCLKEKAQTVSEKPSTFMRLLFTDRILLITDKTVYCSGQCNGSEQGIY